MPLHTQRVASHANNESRCCILRDTMRAACWGKFVGFEYMSRTYVDREIVGCILHPICVPYPFRQYLCCARQQHATCSKYRHTFPARPNIQEMLHIDTHSPGTNSKVQVLCCCCFL